MKYMLLIHGDESKMNTATIVDDTGMSPEYHAYNTALVKAGVMLGGERLRPTTATTLVPFTSLALSILPSSSPALMPKPWNNLGATT